MCAWLRSRLQASTILTSGLLALSSVSAPAAAQSSWAGTISYDWFVNENWAPGGVPMSSDAVVIDNTINKPAIVNGTASAATLTIGDAGTGQLDLGNGAILNVGTVVIASQAGSTGTLGIDDAVGFPPGAAGTLNAATVTFGAGNGTLNLKHNRSDYVLATSLVSDVSLGDVNLLTGTTALTGDNSGYRSRITVSGGATLTGTSTGLNLGLGGAIVMENGSTIAFADGVNVRTSVVAGSSSSYSAYVADGATASTATLGTGPGSLVDKTGGGTLVITALSFSSGQVRISDGRLQFGDGNFATGLYVAIENNSILAFNHARTDTFSNVISGTGIVEHNGSGTTVLSGANTYEGGTHLNAGTLQVATNANLGSGGLTFNGGTLQNTQALVTTRSVTLDAGGGTFRTDADHTIDSIITGDGGLTKTGSGTLVLTADNTYQGGTRLNAGTLQVATNANLGAGGLTFSGGTLQNTQALITTRSVTLDIGGGTFRTDADHTIGSVITGDGGLIKTGSGALVLIADNTYRGGTRIEDGAVQLGDGGTSGAISGDVVFGQGPGAARLVVNRSDMLTLDGSISGAGQVWQAGNGTTVLAGGNSYSGGTVITAGTLVAGSATAMGTGNVQIADGATLGYIAGVTVGNVIYPTGTDFNLHVADGSATQAGQVLGSFTKTGAGTLVLTANANGATDGTTVITAGTLQLGDGGTTGSLLGAIQNDGVLAFNRSDALPVGPISGSGRIEQNGTGVTMLTADNSYTGATVVNAGTLLARTSMALGVGSDVTVQAGATLEIQGTGSFIAVETASLAGNGNLVIGPDAIFVTGSSNASTAFGGAILGNGSFVKIGDGALTLTGTSRIGGDFVVCCGTLNLYGGSFTNQGITAVIIGTLNVSNGGLLSTAELIVGSALRIDGPGTRVSANGLTQIGQFDAASLVISNGAALDSRNGAMVGGFGEAAATVTVTGSGSTWTVRGDALVIGGAGAVGI
ncbi:autotransporter-associated beta strand repeat-containing protein, partial [Vineibacter terrae]|uniref:autotransporter-associated beta strand repeat-containing protein n=1 Tax=Vineibacter terrae TaxID=2586908 RepID=UPI002E2FC06A